MAEQENPEIPPASNQAADAPAEFLHDADGQSQDVEEYSGMGFDPEQRRFLWTITGVLILGMGAATWINASHDDRARQNYFRVQEAVEVHRGLQQRFVQLRQSEFNKLVNAILQNDDNTKAQVMKEFSQAFMAERNSYAAAHHLAGLDDVTVTDETRANAEDEYLSNASQAAAQYRQQQQAKSSTQPATRP